MREPKEPKRSEDAAHEVQVKGWACKHCNRFWGTDERMARYCCSDTFPCECGGRRTKSWTKCEDCRRDADSEKWRSREAVQWDGQFPLTLQDSDEYFWDADDLIDYAMDRSQEIQGANIANTDEDVILGLQDLRLVGCTPNNGRHFDMTEYLCDELVEDAELPDAWINEAVNAWIQDNAPFSWSARGPKLCIESVVQGLGLDATEIQESKL